MPRLVKWVDPRNEYEARRVALQEEGTDALRCSHPSGPLKCVRMMACKDCPYSEAVELDLAA